MGTQGGKLGESVLYRARGEQLQRAYIRNVANPKTTAQMSQRTQLYNIIAVYRAAISLFKLAFENKKSNQSDYNAFVGVNLNAVKVYIQKGMAQSGGGVVAPYMITRGSLPSIQITGQGVGAVTNIGLGDLVIDDTTSVAALTEALLANNTNFQVGDQLSYVSIIQSTNTNTGYPQLSATLYEITLSLEDDSTVRSHIPAVGATSVDGFLGHGASIGSGAFAWVLSRKKADGSLAVSTQRLIVTATTLYQSYADASAITRAVSSYDGQPDAFLTPGYSGGSNSGQSATIPSVSSVSAGNTIIQNGDGTQNIAAGAAITITGSNLPLEEDLVLKYTTQYNSTPTTVITVTAGAKSDTQHVYNYNGSQLSIAGFRVETASGRVLFTATRENESGGMDTGD